MRVFFFALTISLFTPFAFAKNSNVEFDEILRGCISDNGNELTLPLGPEVKKSYPIRIKRGEMTPAGVEGVVTISPLVAYCVAERLDTDLIIFDLTSSVMGLKGAYPFTKPYYYNGTGPSDLVEFLLKGNLDIPVLVYCASQSCSSSLEMAITLSLMGYKNILWLRDGLNGWIDKGYPVVDISSRSYLATNGQFKVRLSSDQGVCDLSRLSRPDLQYYKFYSSRSNVYLNRLKHDACVDSNDSSIVEAAKVSELWHFLEKTNNLSQLDTSQDLINRNVLRSAIAKKDDLFINNVLKWKVNLNKPDVDGLTLLDFLKLQKEKSISSVEKNAYNRYYNLFKSAGAKHGGN